MESITAGQLSTTIYVLLAVFAGMITVDKVIDIIKKWRAPSTDTVIKLANDKKRLDEQQEELGRQQREIDTLKESARVQSAALMALLDHELHNGNADQMQRARDDIMRYLQDLLAK